MGTKNYEGDILGMVFSPNPEKNEKISSKIYLDCSHACSKNNMHKYYDL